MTFRYRGDAGKIRAIAAGPTCSMATDAQGSLWLWGKWKNSGDGGSGTPWMQPRPYMGLSGWNISAIAMGLFTLFAIGDGGKAISWGQNASNGELGHGPDEPKSSTQAKLIPSLEGITAYALACGMRTSLILVSPDDPKVKQLPRTNVPESASVSAVKGATKPKATKASPESPAAGATAGQACEICEKTTSPKTNPLRVCGT
ncbi:RCC1/BLIP-II, partial [Caulochytrium protostelioides]